MSVNVLVILVVIAAFLCFIAIFYDKGTTDDAIMRRKNFIEGKGNKQEAIDELNESFYSRFIAPAINKIRGAVAKINEKENKNAKQSNSMKIAERQLRLAGLDMSAEAYMFYKQWFMIFAVVVAVGLLVVLDVQVLIKVCIGAGGFAIALLAPNLFLSTMASTRQEAIRLQVPDALDLLAVCIEAGLSFDAALLKVSEKIEGPFIDELLIVYREIQMGVPRNDALKRLSEATEISELKTFISALIQANQLGIPINNVMAVQSQQLRETRKQQAKEKGAKAPTKMLIPMVGLIFPVLFIILMGPVVLQIMDTL